MTNSKNIEKPWNLYINRLLNETLIKLTKLFSVKTIEIIINDVKLFKSYKVSIGQEKKNKLFIKI